MSASSLKLTQSDWRTLGAIIAEIPSYSRVEDDVYIAQLAKTANLGESTVRRSIAKLDKLGVIHYDGHRGPGRAGRISLIMTAQLGEQSQSAHEAEQSTEPRPLKNTAPDRSTRVAHTEKDREENYDVALETAITNIGFVGSQITRAREANRDLVIAWVRHAQAITGLDKPPAAFADTGIRTGDWPPDPTTRPHPDPLNVIEDQIRSYARSWPGDIHSFTHDVRTELDANPSVPASEIDRLLALAIEERRRAGLDLDYEPDLGDDEPELAAPAEAA